MDNSGNNNTTPSTPLQGTGELSAPPNAPASAQDPEMSFGQPLIKKENPSLHDTLGSLRSQLTEKGILGKDYVVPPTPLATPSQQSAEIQPQIIPEIPRNFQTPQTVGQEVPPVSDISTPVRSFTPPQMPLRTQVPSASPPAPEKTTPANGIGETVAPQTILQKNAPPNTLSGSTQTTSHLVRPLRTYKDDIAQAVKEHNVSLVSAVAAEEKKRRTGPIVVETAKQGVKLYLLALMSIFFITAGGGALWLAYELKIVGGGGVEVIDIPSHLFTEHQRAIDLPDGNRTTILNILAAEIERSVAPLNAMEQLYFTEGLATPEGSRARLISAEDLLGRLELHAPSSFLRALDDDFTFGIHSFGGLEPFLVLKTSSYDTAFAGMLEWEKNMSNDLAPVFGPALSTSAGILGAGSFEDVVIQSRDARILRRGNGDIALMYAFLDRETIILTTNRNTFMEILTRMASIRQ